MVVKVTQNMVVVREGGVEFREGGGGGGRKMGEGR